MLLMRNTTDMKDEALGELFRAGLHGWNAGTIRLWVRYSRGADFSGTCYYADQRVFINIGRHVAYPYHLKSNIARAKTHGRVWRRPLYSLEIRSNYQLALFIFMHELFHILVKRSKRNTRQKEGMCDRFAARHLVDRHDVRVFDHKGLPADRCDWDFQNLDGFVARAQDRHAALVAPKPFRVREQLLLFG